MQPFSANEQLDVHCLVSINLTEIGQFNSVKSVSMLGIEGGVLLERPSGEHKGHTVWSLRSPLPQSRTVNEHIDDIRLKLSGVMERLPRSKPPSLQWQIVADIWYGSRMRKFDNRVGISAANLQFLSLLEADIILDSYIDARGLIRKRKKS